MFCFSRRFSRGALLAVWSLALVAASSAWALEVVSPDNLLAAAVKPDAQGRLLFSVTVGGKPILLPSPLGIVVDGEDLGQDAALGAARASIVNETYPTMGGHARALNQCRQVAISVTGGAKRTAWVLELRAYNDGAAYRYMVAGEGEREIKGETSSWVFPPGGTIWYQSSKSRDYEQGFMSGPLESLPQEQSIMSDCTIQLGGGLGYVMPTEANLVGYSDLILQPDGVSRFRAVFPHDSKGWKQKGAIVSPWRVVLYARDLNGLVNSDLLRNLCPPPKPELVKAPWIVPGRANWHWMVTGQPKLEQQHQWVDWTSQLGWEYYLIDDGWVKWADAGQDQWACMKQVTEYAKTKRVRIFAWVHTKEVTEPAARLAYFKKAKEAGLVGLKIDFMGPPNAEWVAWYDDTLRDAAAAQLMVDFHGCVKPSGRERTWPNEMTREAIKGRENGRRPGLELTTLPFTRYVQGHADFTPTDWREGKLRGASFANELAQAVVFTSALLCYSGAPENYFQNEGLDVLKAIPATWDETIVLPGSAIGEVAAFARRKGPNWYVGVVNGSTARTLEIPLSFLPVGAWKIEKLADSPEKNDAWKHEKTAAKGSDVLKVDLRAEGGFVARITH